MLIGSICAAIAICLLGGFLCFRYVRQTFDEVDHMLDQAIQGHFDFATIAGETRQGKLCHKVKRLIQKLQAGRWAFRRGQRRRVHPVGREKQCGAQAIRLPD